LTNSASTIKTKQKNVTASFYISGQEKKSIRLKTAQYFKEAYSKHQKLGCVTKIEPIKRPLSIDTNRDLNFRIISHDSKEKSYFGYISVARDTFLPSMYNKKDNAETDIQLHDDQSAYERSYFLYFEEYDILVFNNNRLGPRPDDLAYVLTRSSDDYELSFDAIWNQKALQDVLKKGEAIKKCSVTIALPRNFKESQLDLESPFSETIVKLMSDNGMSKLKLDFWGRASNKKNTLGYLSHEISEGIKEFIDKYGSKLKATDPQIKKAELQPAGVGLKPENLLSQELKYTTKVNVVRGYPALKDVKWALMSAFKSNIGTLTPYKL
tara:strand:+ start:26377 stop:27348 length:972 start_codon:yes stop_codon:yes gene_type:complete